MCHHLSSNGARVFSNKLLVFFLELITFPFQATQLVELDREVATGLRKLEDVKEAGAKDAKEEETEPAKEEEEEAAKEEEEEAVKAVDG